MTPRIPPTTEADRDERTEEMLSAFFKRPDGTVLNIFSTLAHHPKLLKRWSQFGGTLLFGGTLDGRDREILILRTGWLCDAEYEWGQHVDIGKAMGLTDEDIERIHREGAAGEWPENERALIQAADELHEDHVISDETWKVLDAHYDYQQLIEICMVVGQYHMVAFTLNSLGIEPEPGLTPFPKKS